MDVGVRDDGQEAEMSLDPYRIADLKYSTIIDIGANVGAFALYAQSLQPGVQIDTYEANYENYQLLVANTHDDSIRCIHAAIWSHNRGVNVVHDYTTSHVCLDPHTCIASSACHEPEITTIWAPSLTLDEILHPVDLLKIDIEGGEHQAIPGTKNLSMAKHLRMEFHDYYGPGARSHLWQLLSEVFTMTDYDTVPGRGGIWVATVPDEHIILEGDLNVTAPLRVDFNDDTFHFNEMYVKGEWEPATRACLQRFLSPGDLFLDVGAWIGPVTMWAVNLGATVIALEPDMDAFESLLVNTEGYPVTALPVALSDRDGVAYFTNPRFFGDSQSRIARIGERIVNCVTAETLLTGIEPALVKVDIEGHETVIMEALTNICRARGIPLHISWHEPWWTWAPHPNVFPQWFEGFDLEGSIGGWGSLIAVPR